MSPLRKLLQEESEHQWLSFAVFTVFVIIGAVLIDWSSELSGVYSGSTLEVDGVVHDVAGDAILYENENGMNISVSDTDYRYQLATCISQYEQITYACLGVESVIGFIDPGLECEQIWCFQDIGENNTATDLSVNNGDLLIILQNGVSNSIAAMKYNSTEDPYKAELEGVMHLQTITTTSDGWLVGGSWQAPTNWLGTNPASPPLYELVLAVTWDGISSPDVEIIYIGGEGEIHGIYDTDNGYIATGTAETVRIVGEEVSTLGINSYTSVMDKNKNVWLFGGYGSKTVAIITDEEIAIEKLPEPLTLEPTFAYCNEEGIISIHGYDTQSLSSSISIDSNARSSFFSLRGILDLGFISISILILSMMGWNVADALRKGEVF